jgi:hypothetical protein
MRRQRKTAKREASWFVLFTTYNHGDHFTWDEMDEIRSVRGSDEICVQNICPKSRREDITLKNWVQAGS